MSLDPSPELLRAFSLSLPQYHALVDPESECTPDEFFDLQRRGLLDENGRTPLGDTVTLSITLLIH